MLDALGARVEDRGDYEQADSADRQVDVEDPPPRRVVDDEAADQRTDDRCGPERRPAGSSLPILAAKAHLAATMPGRRQSIPPRCPRQSLQRPETISTRVDSL